MKIVYLSTAKIPSRAANSVHIMKMCSAFAVHGHDVTLVAPSVHRSFRKEQPQNLFSFYDVPQNFRIKRIYYPGGKYGEYVYAMLVQLSLMFKDVDLFMSRNLLSSFFTSWKHSIQILELHQPLPASSRVQRRILKYYTGKSNFSTLVVITNPLQQIFVNEYNIPAERILVAPDGADIKDYPVESGNAPEKLQVGYLGHLYRGRGVEIILEMARACSGADFHIVGGTEADIQRVREQSQGIDNIKIHGYVSPGQAERIRIAMDVLLAPYQRKVGLGSGTLTTEKWMSPLKVFEYMAAGKALICSDIPVLHEVLQHEENCLLCVPDNARDWIKALKRLSHDVPFRESLGVRAKEDIIMKYSWKVRAEKIIARMEND